MSPGERKYAVGFIGIGKMGLPMATRIATHGYPLHVCNASAAALSGAADRTEIYRMLERAGGAKKIPAK